MCFFVCLYSCPCCCHFINDVPQRQPKTRPTEYPLEMELNSSFGDMRDQTFGRNGRLHQKPELIFKSITLTMRGRKKRHRAPVVCRIQRERKHWALLNLVKLCECCILYWLWFVLFGFFLSVCLCVSPHRECVG